VTEQQGQAPEAADTTTTTTQPQQQDTTHTEAQTAPQRVEDLPDWAQKLIKDTRKESGDYRVKAKEHETAAEQAKREQQEFLDRIAKAAGFKDDDSAPDPDELAKQLTTAQQQAQEREDALQQLRTEREVEKHARTHKGDPTALLDSKDFERALGKLDRADKDFPSALEALVKESIEANPKYQVSPAPTSSSADFSSGPGEKRNNRPTGLYDAVSRTFG